jgi:cytosine/adenosine deaminase-related metal-dependent hydrolase
VGSDSHIVVDPLEELRMIENNERLQRQRRNVLAPALHRPAALGLLPAGVDPLEMDADHLRAAPGLLDMGARQGALALGLHAGELCVGQLADLTCVDLNDPALEGVPPAFLPEALVYSASPRCVRPLDLP